MKKVRKLHSKQVTVTSMLNLFRIRTSVKEAFDSVLMASRQLNTSNSGTQALWAYSKIHKHV